MNGVHLTLMGSIICFRFKNNTRILTSGPSQAGTAWLRKVWVAVRHERWGWKGWPFPSHRSAEKLSVSGVNKSSRYLLARFLRNHCNKFSLSQKDCIVVAYFKFAYADDCYE